MSSLVKIVWLDAGLGDAHSGFDALEGTQHQRLTLALSNINSHPYGPSKRPFHRNHNPNIVVTCDQPRKPTEWLPMAKFILFKYSLTTLPCQAKTDAALLAITLVVGGGWKPFYWSPHVRELRCVLLTLPAVHKIEMAASSRPAQDTSKGQKPKTRRLLARQHS